MMDIDQIANEMAKELGFVSAERTDLTFDGWTIFHPVMRPRGKNEPKPLLGDPLFILALDDTVRWTNGDEGLKVLGLLIDKRKEEEPEEDEEAELSFDERLEALKERAEFMNDPDNFVNDD